MPRRVRIPEGLVTRVKGYRKILSALVDRAAWEGIQVEDWMGALWAHAQHADILAGAPETVGTAVNVQAMVFGSHCPSRTSSSPSGST